MMIAAQTQLDVSDLVLAEIDKLLHELGQGRTLATAYDTAWGARLAVRYPGEGFDGSLEWLRRNQNDDGSWGSPLEHHHDRFISTLAAIVALAEAGRGPRDMRRVRRGETALWKLVGRLGRDDSDTVGFPVLAAALATEADRLNLDVPRAPVRFAKAYKKKVETLFQLPQRDWLSTSLTYSFEAFYEAVHEGDRVLECNNSVSISPSATAAYLFKQNDGAALDYMRSVVDERGAFPACSPIDLFESAWALNQLYAVRAIDPADKLVRRSLDLIWGSWSPERGVSASSNWSLVDIDDTGACYLSLLWGGYPVTSDVFDAFEAEDYFCTYPGETNPSLSAHVRLLAALRNVEDQASEFRRIQKAVTVLHKMDENGSYWWDKWHSSPYYVTGAASIALDGIDDVLSRSRLKWILRTQNDDGGWGYLGFSTAEETAYCLRTLLYWRRRSEIIDSTRIEMAANFLTKHMMDDPVPMWIAKSLYTPLYPVKAAILSAMYDYLDYTGQI